MLCIRLCADVLSGSVWPIYFSFSRDLWSVLSLKIWFTWRVTWRDESVWQVCVTNVMNTSLCRFCPVGVCATNLLSILACLWLIFFLALRMEIWFVSACVTILCTLWSVIDFYSVICGYVILWMHHWSSRYSALCLVELLANGPCHLFLGLSFLKSTAGMPTMGFSYTLNCSVPGRGISGLLRGWLFPFLPFRWLVLLFSFFICKPRPVTTLVTISSQFRCRFIPSDGAIGKGKSLALQSLSLRLP